MTAVEIVPSLDEAIAAKHRAAWRLDDRGDPGGAVRRSGLRRGLTMRLVHLDAVGGLAGDMFVAAMLDALPGIASAGAGGCAGRIAGGGRMVDLVEGNERRGAGAAFQGEAERMAARPRVGGSEHHHGTAGSRDMPTSWRGSRRRHSRRARRGMPGPS